MINSVRKRIIWKKNNRREEVYWRNTYSAGGGNNGNKDGNTMNRGVILLTLGEILYTEEKRL